MTLKTQFRAIWIRTTDQEAIVIEKIVSMNLQFQEEGYPMGGYMRKYQGQKAEERGCGGQLGLSTWLD